MWIAVVALGVFGVVSFYNSTKTRVEQVTVIREVLAPPATPEISAVGAELSPDKPMISDAPSTSYRSMLLEEKKNDNELK